MKPRPLYIVPARARRFLLVGIAALASACEADDLSDALSSGHCDSQGRCAPGFECDTETRECVPLGTLGNTSSQDGGAAGRAGSAGHPGLTGAGGTPTAAGAAGTAVQDGGQAPGNAGSTGSSSGGHAGNSAGSAGLSGGYVGSNAGSAGLSSGGYAGNAGFGALGNAGQDCSGPECACSGGTFCDGDCVDTSSDPANCGACSRICSAHGTSDAPKCVEGKCIAHCTAGLADCSLADTEQDDGCETELATDRLHCGNCNNTCFGQTSALECSQGQCSCTDDASCGTPGSDSSCSDDGLCVCSGKACVVGETCTAKADSTMRCGCEGGPACAKDETCCIASGECVSLDKNEQNCGACGRSCPAAFRCKDGSCQCKKDDECNAGATGLCVGGLCECASGLCQAGERCLADGSCG